MNANKQTVWERMSPKQQAIARAKDRMDASNRAARNYFRNLIRYGSRSTK